MLNPYKMKRLYKWIIWLPLVGALIHYSDEWITRHRRRLPPWEPGDEWFIYHMAVAGIMLTLVLCFLVLLASGVFR